MIIKTRRPASILVLDISITAVAWVAFIYQFTKGVVFLLSERSGTPLSNFSGVSLTPSMATLVVCTVVCLINASLVYIWARWQKSRRERTSGGPGDLVLSADVLADRFNLSLQQLDNVRDSRVTVVYHSPAGGITHLETSDLHLQEVSSTLPEAKLRVA